jgi:proline racemase
MQAANEQLSVQHPEVPINNRINIATAVAAPNDPERTYRNVHVFGDGQFDRSPGGTGTCARMAVLRAKERLAVNEDVWVESVTDGVFRGRILAETSVGDRNAVVPEITGSAHITGFHQFVLDPRDRLKEGFRT